MYTITSVFGFTEEDIYNDGAQPETAQDFQYDLKFSKPTIEELIAEVKNHFDVEDDALLLNSCDEIGRLDVQRLEDENRSIATDKQVEGWKQGKIKLFATTYTMQVAHCRAVDLMAATTEVPF